MTLSDSDAANSAAHRAGDATKDADDPRLASSYLDTLRTRYRHLEGVTVTLGTTPSGQEAVAYYTEGEIVVSRSHVAGITTILDHEIWHIIDWRDNGRLDWGERLPPNGYQDYAIR